MKNIKMNEKIFQIKIRKDIFKLFLNEEKLEFNQIQKALKLRSNNLAYHLKVLIKENILIKDNEYYKITNLASKFIPLFANIIEKKISPLPVVLVGLTNKDETEIILLKRNFRPYKDYYGLIGGRILYDENYMDTTLRLINKKTNIEKKYLKFISLNHIVDEKVYQDNVLLNSFLLFFTKVHSKSFEFQNSEYGQLKWFNIDEISNKNIKIIPSDKWLIQNFLNKKIKIDQITMEDNSQMLKKFKII